MVVPGGRQRFALRADYGVVPRFDSTSMLRHANGEPNGLATGSRSSTDAVDNFVDNCVAAALRVSIGALRIGLLNF